MRSAQQSVFVSQDSLPRMNTFVPQHKVTVGDSSTATKFAAQSKRIRRGIQAELEVVKLLKKFGRSCAKQNHQAHFDILCDGWRLDVKTAEPREATGQQRWHGDRWLFNLHHQGTPIRMACDFFVLRLLGVSKSRPDEIEHLLLRAPFHSTSYVVYTRSFADRLPLMGEFSRFLRGEFGRGPLEVEAALPEACHAS